MTLFRYNTYANHEVLETPAVLTLAEFKLDRGLSRGSVYTMLLHMLGTEAFFLAKCQGRPSPTKFAPREFPTLADIRLYWGDLQNATEEFLASLTEQDTARMLPLDFPGQNLHFPLWQ